MHTQIQPRERDRNRADRCRHPQPDPNGPAAAVSEDHREHPQHRDRRHRMPGWIRRRLFGHQPDGMRWALGAHEVFGQRDRDSGGHQGSENHQRG